MLSCSACPFRVIYLPRHIHLIQVEENENDYYSFTSRVKGIEVHNVWRYVREKVNDPEDFLGKEFEVPMYQRFLTITAYLN